MDNSHHDRIPGPRGDKGRLLPEFGRGEGEQRHAHGSEQHLSKLRSQEVLDRRSSTPNHLEEVSSIAALSSELSHNPKWTNGDLGNTCVAYVEDTECGQPEHHG